MPKSREIISTESDSSEEESPKPRKDKKRQSSTKEDTKGPVKKPKLEEKDEETNTWDLGKNRQVTVREFKGKTYVDIREMYLDKSGDLKPGRKGIMLNMEQWYKFMNIVQDVDKAAKSKC